MCVAIKQLCALYKNLSYIVHSSVSMLHACSVAPLSMEFPRQEHWSGLPFPTPGDLPDPGIEPMSLAFPVLAGRFFTITLPGKPMLFYAND